MSVFRRPYPYHLQRRIWPLGGGAPAAQTINANVISGGAPYQPAVNAGGLTVQVNPISGGAPYQPALTFGAATVAPNAISGRTPNQPAVTFGAISVNAGTIAGGSVYQPTAERGRALHFKGNGADVNRVRIQLDSPADPPIDVGASDFAYEFWARMAYADNTTTATDEDARYSNIILDRDIWGHPRGWVLGVTRSGSNLVTCFGQATAAGTWPTIFGTANVGDDRWHHIALTRSGSTVRIFVDGVQDASGTYGDDLSYPNGETGGGGQDNPYLVIGCEKHDVGYMWTGRMKGLRVSDIARYTSAFQPPVRFGNDADTAALFLFNDSGTTLYDASGLAGAEHGEILVGGSPSGPEWVVGPQFVEPGAIAGGALYQPAVNQGAAPQTVNVNAISGGTVYQPAVTFGAISISVNRINGGAPNQPAVTFGAVAVSVTAIAGGSPAQPALTFGAISLAPNVISGGAPAQPVITQGATIVPSAIAGGAPYQPALTFGAISVSVTAIAGRTPNQPAVQPGAVSVAPQVIAGGTVYQPAVTIGGLAVYPQAIAGGAPLLPALTFGAISVQPQAIAGGAPSLPMLLLLTAVVSASRTLRVAAESRVVSVAAERRVITVAAESRTREA